MPQVTTPPPPPIGVNTLLRKLFTIMTGSSRGIQSLQQAFGTMSTDIQQVRADMLTTHNFASDASRESLASRRAIETVNGRLSMYAGRVDNYIVVG